MQFCSAIGIIFLLTNRQCDAETKAPGNVSNAGVTIVLTSAPEEDSRCAGSTFQNVLISLQMLRYYLRAL